MTKFPPEASNESQINKTAYSDCPSCGYKNALAITQTRRAHALPLPCRLQSGGALAGASCARTIHHPAATLRSPRKHAVPLAFISALWERSQVPCRHRRRNLSQDATDIRRDPALDTFSAKPLSQADPHLLAGDARRNQRREGTDARPAPDLSGSRRLGEGARAAAEDDARPGRGLSCHLAYPQMKSPSQKGSRPRFPSNLRTGIPTWAALSAGGLRRLVLPPAPNAGLVTIAADADVVGIEAARVAALRWKGEGRQVRVIVPSRPGTDFNDLIMQASP